METIIYSDGMGEGLILTVSDEPLVNMENPVVADKIRPNL